VKALSCILAAIAFLQANSVGGPKDGGWTEPLELPAGSPDNPSFKDLSKKVTFAAGQRACVIVTGRDGNKSPEADLKLLILDAKNNEVAGDHGAYNLVAVWYPKEDMTVTVRVLNPDSHEHLVFVSVK
jgi:hypothetical protein